MEPNGCARRFETTAHRVWREDTKRFTTLTIDQTLKKIKNGEDWGLIFRGTCPQRHRIPQTGVRHHNGCAVLHVCRDSYIVAVASMRPLIRRVQEGSGCHGKVRKGIRMGVAPNYMRQLVLAVNGLGKPAFGFRQTYFICEHDAIGDPLRRRCHLPGKDSVPRVFRSHTASCFNRDQARDPFPVPLYHRYWRKKWRKLEL